MSLSSKIVVLFCILQFGLQGQEVIPVFQTGHFSKVNELKFHPNNQHLVSAGDDGKIIVWDINIGLQRATVLAQQSGVLDFDFLNDSTIISLGGNNQITTWTFPNLQQKNTIEIKTDSIQAFSVLRNSVICLVGKRVHFYDLESQRLQTTQYKSKWLFKSVDFHPQRNEILVAGPRDNYAVSIDLKDPLVFDKYFVGNIHKANYVDSLLLFATTMGSLKYMNNGAKKKRFYTLIDDLNYVSDMDANSTSIAVGTAFGFTTVFSRKTQKIIANIGLNGNAISAVSYSQNGSWLATANTKGAIYLFDAENYKINKILKGASASIVDLKVYNNKMVVGYSDGIIRLIDLENNRIKSNSIKLDQVEEQNGINYAVISIDTILDSKVVFTVLKTDRHHIKTSLITQAVKMKAEWELNTNEIALKKSIAQIALRRKVHQNFVKSIPFRFSDFTKSETNYQFGDSRYIIDSKKYNFTKVKNNEMTSFEIKHTAPISGLRFLPTYNLILSFSNDGSIRFWNTKGQYLAVLYLSGQYNFFYQNRKNFYFASKEILDKIGFIYRNKLYAYEQYDVYYNRPAEVMRDLSYFQKDDISDYQKAYQKRLQKLGLLRNELSVSENLPEILVDYFDDYSTKKEVVKFSLAMADLEGEIISYSFVINGIEKRIKLLEPKEAVTAELEVGLAAGINQIDFFCTNNKGIRSLIKKKIITCEKNFQKPDLYLVTIGVSNYQDSDFNLKYSSKDANDMASLLNKSKAYSNIRTLSYYDTSFVKNAQGEIASFLDTAKINDVIVFFYAGHGVLDDKFNYYLATHNMDFEKPEEKGLSFDGLENLFEDLNCRNKLMMIDACFSGEIDKSSLSIDSTMIESGDEIQFRSAQSAAIDDNGDMGIFELSKRVFTDLRVSKGTNILSSSSGIEYSLEGDKWGNGLFTYVLKQGLENKAADLNDDKQIRILEMQVYLRETVSALSEGNQNPILRKENIKNNFVIW
ncbi:MAG: caspase family protein [Crocinitomicaceae bacterium]